MEAFGFIGVVYLLAGIIQLIILFVLIVKFLQLVADVKQLKNLYTERSRELSSSIDKLSSAIKEQSNFKQHLRKWKILKNKGYTDQAIREYMEYTKRNMNSAVDFINSI